MKKSYLYLIKATIIVLFTVCQTYSYAQATRTWVSGVGDDVNPCSRTAPCKTFAGAISKTAASGEISTLDPGGFGAVTITKSITISGDGTLAGILSSLTTGIIINAGVNDVVTIRNVSINGAGNGTNGIRYIAGGKVHIENCTIQGFTTAGIIADLTASGILTVKNTSITPINNTTTYGVDVKTTVGTAVATISNCHVQGNFVGIRGRENSIINVENTVVSNNGTGINPEINTSVINMSNLGIYNNTTGIGNGAGKVFTFGNNKMAGNTIPSSAPNGIYGISQQ